MNNYVAKIDGVVKSPIYCVVDHFCSLGDKLLGSDEYSIEWELTPLQKDIQQLKDELSKPEKEHQEYLQQRKKWQKRIAEAFGDKAEPQKGSLRQLTAELVNLAGIPKHIDSFKQRRMGHVKEIYQLKTTLKEKFRQLQSPVQQFIAEHPRGRTS